MIKNGKLPAFDLCDEIFLQLYQKLNCGSQPEEKERSRLVFLVLALVSKYIEPSNNLKSLISSWLLSKKDDRQFERFVRLILQNFKMQKTVEGSQKPHVNWAPSIAAIEALDKNKPFQVQVVWPTGDGTLYPIDDFTTIEHLLLNKVYKEKFFSREPDSEMYWLFMNDEEEMPVPVPKDKKVAKLIYEDEFDA